MSVSVSLSLSLSVCVCTYIYNIHTQVGGVPETLAMVCKQGGSGQVKKWAALAVACTLMVDSVRKEALDLDQGASVVSLAESVLLLGRVCGVSCRMCSLTRSPFDTECVLLLDGSVVSLTECVLLLGYLLLQKCVLLLGASVVSAVAPLLHMPDNRHKFSKFSKVRMCC